MATHELVRADGLVTKRFTDWARGEHRREWLILTALHRHAPELIPVPVSQELDAIPPTVTMTVLPGTPLAGALTAPQRDALEAALRLLWTIPVDGLPPRRFTPDDVARLPFDDRPAGVLGAAFAAAADFMAEPRPAGTAHPVIGHGDSNLANYLWDGSRVRIVDFEDAGRSDLGYELGSMIEHRSAWGTNWSGFAARFDIDPAALLDGRRWAAILWLHVLRRRGTGEPTRQAERVLSLLRPA